MDVDSAGAVKGKGGMNMSQLHEKVEQAIERIRFGAQVNGGKPLYLCQSGGKDSCVIEHLAVASGVEFTSNHNLTGIDHPELIYHLRKHYPETIIHRPEKTFGSYMLDKQFPPLRQQRWCCELLKEGGGDGVIVIGIRWAESSRRAKRKFFEVCRKDKERRYLSPIIDWSDADVWTYIRDNKLPYCGLYDEGYDRLGCLMCPMASAKQRKAEARRYPRYKRLYLRWFTRLYEHRQREGRPVENWNSPEEFFDWWLCDDVAAQEKAGQMCLAFDD